MSEYPAGPGPQSPQEKQGQQGTFQEGKTAAREVAQTARQQSGVVAGEARKQTRQAVEQLRDRTRAQAQHQSERAAQGIRQWADDLAAMNDSAKPDSPVSGVVRQIADGGRRAADYLDEHGLAGVVSDVQDFARRRPAAFLAGALAAGFLVGRITKAVTDTGHDDEAGARASRPRSAFDPQESAPAHRPSPAYGGVPAPEAYGAGGAPEAYGTLDTSEAYPSAPAAESRPAYERPEEQAARETYGARPSPTYQTDPTLPAGPPVERPPSTGSGDRP